MLRSILGILLGMVLGVVLIFSAELATVLVHPLPADFDPNNAEAMKTHLANIPVGALLLVALGHFLGTLVGSWVAARIARRAELVHALIVGGLFLVVGIYNLSSFPHPAWFWALDLAMFPLAACLGGFIARQRALAEARAMSLA